LGGNAVRTLLALTLALLTSAAAVAQSSTAAGEAVPPRTDTFESVEHVRALLARPPSRLTLAERKPDFSVTIEKKRPMQDIFEIPPWQLPPIGWQPPAWGTGINLLSVVSYVAKNISEAKRGHDERKAREEVQQSIAEWCAAQDHHGAYISICPQR
jgi:hypothetical protein